MASPAKRRGKKMYGSYGKVPPVEEAAEAPVEEAAEVVAPKPKPKKKKKSIFG